MAGTYFTDLTHYLDASGAIEKNAPPEARELGSFLALVVDTVSAGTSAPAQAVDTGLRCRIPECQGDIRGLITPKTAGDTILWQCAICGHHGVISNWRNSRWDNSNRPVTPDEDLFRRAQAARAILADVACPLWKRLHEAINQYAGIKLDPLPATVRLKLEREFARINVILQRNAPTTFEEYAKFSAEDIDAGLKIIAGFTRYVIRRRKSMLPGSSR